MNNMDVSYPVRIRNGFPGWDPVGYKETIAKRDAEKEAALKWGERVERLKKAGNLNTADLKCVRDTKKSNTFRCWTFLILVLGLEKRNVTVQWTVTAISSKTGGNLNVPSPSALLPESLPLRYGNKFWYPVIDTAEGEGRTGTSRIPLKVSLTGLKMHITG